MAVGGRCGKDMSVVDQHKMAGASNDRSVWGQTDHLIRSLLYMYCTGTLYSVQRCGRRVAMLIVVAAMLGGLVLPTPIRRPAPSRGGASIVCRANRKADWARRMPPEAPVAKGSVLAAAPGSFDHYFQESLVLLIEHSDEGTVGVLLNHQTPWHVADMTDALPCFADNAIFLGGDAGRDTMLMLHSLPLLDGARPLADGATEGAATSSVCLGGVSAASELVQIGQLRAAQFKFFYKSVEWLPGQLEEQCGEGLFEHVELSPSLLLGQTGQRVMWEEVRQLIRRGEQEAEEAAAAAAAGVASPTAEAEVPVIENLPATRYAPSADTSASAGARPQAASASAASAAPSAPLPAPPPAVSEVAEVCEYRHFKGNDQWLVRWAGADPPEETWESMAVVEECADEDQRARAVQLRDERAAP